MVNSGDFTLADLRSDSQRSLFTWFSTFNERRTLPSRADFEPLDFPTSLRDLVLIDVETAPVRYRVRLVGTAITEARGQDATGNYYDEVHGTEDATARADATVKNGKPSFLIDVPMTWSPKDYRRYNVLTLPLASDGATVDMIMYCLTFE